jgi:hypothetical protein
MIQSVFNFKDQIGKNNYEKFIKSVRFTEGDVAELQFESKSEAVGFSIGKLIIPLLIIVGVVVYVVKNV